MKLARCQEARHSLVHINAEEAVQRNMQLHEYVHIEFVKGFAMLIAGIALFIGVIGLYDLY